MESPPRRGPLEPRPSLTVMLDSGSTSDQGSTPVSVVGGLTSRDPTSVQGFQLHYGCTCKTETSVFSDSPPSPGTVWGRTQGPIDTPKTKPLTDSECVETRPSSSTLTLFPFSPGLPPRFAGTTSRQGPTDVVSVPRERPRTQGSHLVYVGGSGFCRLWCSHRRSVSGTQ